MASIKPLLAIRSVDSIWIPSKKMPAPLLVIKAVSPDSVFKGESGPVGSWEADKDWGIVLYKMICLITESGRRSKVVSEIPANNHAASVATKNVNGPPLLNIESRPALVKAVSVSVALLEFVITAVMVFDLVLVLGTALFTQDPRNSPQTAKPIKTFPTA